MIQSIIVVGVVFLLLLLLLSRKNPTVEQEAPITEANAVYPQEEKKPTAIEVSSDYKNTDEPVFKTLTVKRTRVKRTGYSCLNCKNFDPIKPIRKRTKKEE